VKLSLDPGQIFIVGLRLRPGVTHDQANAALQTMLVEHIFHSALEFPLPDRAAYLARPCGDDAELRSEVASLLENDRDDTATIHRAVDGDLRRLAEAADRSEIGERVGPYRLVRDLDGGGMGIVYLAVRSDDHYFQIVGSRLGHTRPCTTNSTGAGRCRRAASRRC
jgi:hypothetical protein